MSMKISVTPCFQGMEGKKTFSVHDRAYTCKTSNCRILSWWRFSVKNWENTMDSVWGYCLRMMRGFHFQEPRYRSTVDLFLGILVTNIVIRNRKIVWMVAWFNFYLRLNLISERYQATSEYIKCKHWKHGKIKNQLSFTLMF